MKLKIIPSIIAKNQKEFDERFKKIERISKEFHLDVMDGKFVKNKSLNFDLELPRKKYQVHLMVKNPEEYIEIVRSKSESIFFHFESTKNPQEIIDLIKSKKKKVGLAINPKTKIQKIKPYLKKINFVLLMTVNPGRYGSKFLPETLKKITELKKLKPNIKIGLDGGINEKTISKIKKYSINFIVVGSYLQKSKDIKNTLSKLK